MKRKEKIKLLEKICDGITTDKEALFAVYNGEVSGECYVNGDMELARKGIADILRIGIAGEEGNPLTIAAWTILGALRDLQDDGVDIKELLTAFDEEDEDCDTCELLNVCDSLRAFAWRNVLGIRRPKKERTVEIM